MSKPELQAVPQLTIPADAGISSAKALRAMLAEHINDPQPVAIDAGSVTRISTASVQLLLAFVHCRNGAHRSTHWLAVSPALVESATWLGLAERLHLPESDCH